MPAVLFIVEKPQTITFITGTGDGDLDKSVYAAFCLCVCTQMTKDQGKASICL